MDRLSPDQARIILVLNNGREEEFDCSISLAAEISYYVQQDLPKVFCVEWTSENLHHRFQFNTAIVYTCLTVTKQPLPNYHPPEPTKPAIGRMPQRLTDPIRPERNPHPSIEELDLDVD